MIQEVQIIGSRTRFHPTNGRPGNCQVSQAENKRSREFGVYLKKCQILILKHKRAHGEVGGVVGGDFGHGNSILFEIYDDKTA